VPKKCKEVTTSNMGMAEVVGKPLGIEYLEWCIYKKAFELSF
jgi:hypothetical protein